MPRDAGYPECGFAGKNPDCGKEEAMIKIVWNRRCLKCHGQCYLEKNEDGRYLVCLQCGRNEKVDEPEPVSRGLAPLEAPHLLAGA